MTRQQRRSRSVYLNGMRKVGYHPANGWVYRKGDGWMRRFFFRLCLYHRQKARLELTTSGAGRTWRVTGDGCDTD